MLKRVLLFLALASLLLVTGILALGALAGGSCGGMLGCGRTVMAHSDSWYLTSTFTGDVATIETAGRTIVVGPTNLQVDGRSLGSIDASVKSVDVVVEGREISFVADGRKVASCPR